jgi:hypothetical protein
MKSSSKNFLFIHIPKTGGNAVQKILMPYCDDKVYRRGYKKGKLNDFEIENELGLGRKHEWLGSYDNNPQALIGDLSEYFKFTIVRNPWERMVSWYCWQYPSISQRLDKDHFRENILEAKHPSMRQYISLGTEVAMDYIIRYEHLESGTSSVCKKLNIPFNGLEVTNASQHPHYSRFYTPADAEFLGRKYRDDIEEWGYAFERE